MHTRYAYFAAGEVAGILMAQHQERGTLLFMRKVVEDTPPVDEQITLLRVFNQVAQVAAADTSVLILGESGTGKELIARAVHNLSLRRGKLLGKVNCAALPANLIESELFGHEKGAFTGATERRNGKFELAHGGTIFLDEIGEMPLDLQAKLLRVLQEKEIERLGGKGTKLRPWQAFLPVVL